MRLSFAAVLGLACVSSARQCRDLVIELDLESRNAVFNLTGPASPVDAINFALNLARQGHNATAEFLTGVSMLEHIQLFTQCSWHSCAMSLLMLVNLLRILRLHKLSNTRLLAALTRLQRPTASQTTALQIPFSSSPTASTSTAHTGTYPSTTTTARTWLERPTTTATAHSHGTGSESHSRSTATPSTKSSLHSSSPRCSSSRRV